MAHTTDSVRNVTLIGAGGAGKTTLLEMLLHLGKVSTRRGTIGEKNTISDWDDDEKERQHSIVATPVHMPWEGHHLNFVDTPGALDFIGEAVCGLAASETAILCVSAHDGINVATRRMFRAARDAGMACLIVVTRIESENVDGDSLYLQIQSVIGERAVPLNLPDTFGHGASSVVDVFAKQIPDALRDQAEMYRQQATDRVVECDDALLERYLSSGKVSHEELAEVFPRALRQGNIVPILHASVDKNVGLRKLLDFLIKDCPHPSTRKGLTLRPAATAEGQPVAVRTAGPFSAQVWKIHVDPHVGKVAYLRVWSGTLQSKSHFIVARTGATERIGDLLELQGKDMKAVAAAHAGDIVAVAKVDDIRIGDTVCEEGVNWRFLPIPTPRPKVTLAIEVKNRNDEAKLGPELHKLADADPTFISEREPGTGEMVVRGMSTLHVDIQLKRLARRKVEAIVHTPRVPYFETITGKGEAMYRHKKQSGGRGQFAEVHLKVEPLPRGERFEFVDAVVGGVIPRQFIPAVEKGVIDACDKGVLAGYPFIDVRAIVHFGKYHDVDSDEHSFKLASAMAFRDAVHTARPVLLEPILEVDIDVPSRFMGDISGDLNSRRGRIVSMNQSGDSAQIKASVPLSEMLNYSTELRSLTAGEGDYEFRMDHYDVLPSHLAADVIARSRKEHAHS